MKYYIGITDISWYKYLSHLMPDEVNFWKPGEAGFTAIEIGAPFIFKLAYPVNKIVGGGNFVRYEKLPLTLAWDAFQEKNGVSCLKDLKSLISKYRHKKEDNPSIGCIILNNPFFLDERDWINAPQSWSKNIVSGKIYYTDNSEGLLLWENIAKKRDYTSKNLIQEPVLRYGKEYLMKARLGQGAFRILVTSAYSRRCAITEEKTLPVLEAAHILPFVEDGPNQVNNGILLRSDLHKLFDSGYITINENYIVEVSRKIKEEYENGKDYYVFHGKQIKNIPLNLEERPNHEYIRWHNENIYNG